MSGLQHPPVQAFSFAEGTKVDSAFRRSVVTGEQRDLWRDRSDVKAAEIFGNMIVDAKSQDGKPVGLTLFGLERGSFLEPTPAEGHAPTSDTDIVVSNIRARYRVKVGDVITH